MLRIRAPLHDWHRHYPTAKRLAGLLTPELLRLSTGILVADLRERFGVCESTAQHAVGFARKKSQGIE